MKITFDCPDKINGLLTMTVEPADYQEKVEKTLKDYRKKAQVPGFRPGMVPMGMIKKQYGTAVKVDEVNKLMGEKLYEYIHENKIQMLGEPLPNQEKQVPQDFEKDGELTFVFDIAVAPEFKAELSAKDKITYYTIKADDKLIDDQVQMYASQAGEFVKADTFSGNDTLTGDLRELDADGNTKEGGITTLEEKSLGCTQKSGHSDVKDVLYLGDQVKISGLNLLNGPGNDMVACTNLACAGAHTNPFPIDIISELMNNAWLQPNIKSVSPYILQFLYT